MLSTRYNRLTSQLVIVAYVAASTLSGLFHSHADHDHAAPSHGVAVCHHDEAEHDCQPDDVARGLISHPTDDNSWHDDDCAVCRFVGQRTMPIESGQVDLHYDLSVELAVVHSICTAIAVERTTHSRAPPLLG